MISILLTARELIDPVFLDAVNSLLVSGEYAHIFSNDELDGLLQVSLISLLMYSVQVMVCDMSGLSIQFVSLRSVLHPF